MQILLATTENLGWPAIAVGLVLGFVLLTRGADWLVLASSQTARRRGVSTLVIGLTIVALGTSAPEIVVSTVAALDGKVALSLGNVLGSNVANLGFVLGVSAMILPGVLETRLTWRDAIWSVAALVLVWWISSDHRIGRAEALGLLGAFLLYNLHLMRTGREEILREEQEHEGHYRRPGLWLLAGLIAIAVGAKLVVVAAQAGALRLGIPEAVIGLSVVAVGTSLPELAAGVGGALRGDADLSVGNVVGSNIFNLLAVIGIAALVHPFDPSRESEATARELGAAFDRALALDFPVVAAFTLAGLLLPLLGRGRAGRSKGFVLLVGYVAYISWMYVG